jgi:glycosyltransferase involved in cell wall biosynthesis
MRILMLCDRVYPDVVGGIEVHVNHLAHALNALGHEVVVASPDLGQPREARTLGGLPIRYYPTGSTLDPLQFRHETPPPELKRFSHWLEDLRPDIVHAHDQTAFGSIFHLEVARTIGAAAIQSFHTAMTTCMRRRFPLMRWGTIACDGALRPGRCTACALNEQRVPRLAAIGLAGVQRGIVGLWPNADLGVGVRAAIPATIRRRRRWILRIARTVERIIVAAEWQVRSLTANGVDVAKIRHIRHGADGSPSRPPDTTRTVIGWAGRPVPEKGLLEFVRAIRGASELDVEVRLACGGPHPADRAYLEEVRCITGGDSRFVWYPPYDAGRCSEFFSTLDVFVAPYRNMEVGPLTVMEALAHGVPVIGFAVGGTAELVRDGISGRLIELGGDEQCKLQSAIREACDPIVRKAWRSSCSWTRTYHDVAVEHAEVYGASLATAGIVPNEAFVR